MFFLKLLQKLVKNVYLNDYFHIYIGGFLINFQALLIYLKTNVISTYLLINNVLSIVI